MSKGSQDNLLSGKSSTNLSLFCCDTGNTGTGGSTFTTPITTTSTTDSTSTTTGSIITAGGIGIGKSVYMGGKLHVTDSTQSTTINTGCIQATGGVGIVKNLHVGGAAHITDTTNTTTGLDGSLFTNGGLGVAKSLYVAGSTASSSTSTGALIVTGGAGIGGTVTGGTITSTGFNGNPTADLASTVTTIKSTGSSSSPITLATYQGNINLSPGSLSGGSGPGSGGINCNGTVVAGTIIGGTGSFLLQGSDVTTNLLSFNVATGATTMGTPFTTYLATTQTNTTLSTNTIGSIKILSAAGKNVIEADTSDVVTLGNSSASIKVNAPFKYMNKTSYNGASTMSVSVTCSTDRFQRYRIMLKSGSGLNSLTFKIFYNTNQSLSLPLRSSQDIATGLWTTNQTANDQLYVGAGVINGATKYIDMQVYYADYYYYVTVSGWVAETAALQYPILFNGTSTTVNITNITFQISSGNITGWSQLVEDIV